MNIDTKVYRKHESPTFGNTLLGAVPLVSEVYLMDNIELMKHYPDKYFDLAVVDPPYGIARFGNRVELSNRLCKEAKLNKWDVKPNQDYFDELFRISNNQIKGIVAGNDLNDGVSMSQVDFFKKITVSGLSTGQTIIIPDNNGGPTNLKFIPERAFAVLKAITGTLLTDAILRIGSVSPYNNAFGSTTLTGLSQVGVFINFVAPVLLQQIDISSDPIYVDVLTAATGTGLSVYDLDIYISGKIVS